MPPPEDKILEGIRKRFLEEFNRAMVKDGKAVSRQDLARAIGMDASRISRLSDVSSPTTPMHTHIYTLCKEYGADIQYIYFGKRGDKTLAKEIRELLKRF